jgi:hypothetical protein
LNAELDQGLREEARTICDQLYDPDNAEKLTALGTIYWPAWRLGSSAEALASGHAGRAANCLTIGSWESLAMLRAAEKYRQAGVG